MVRYNFIPSDHQIVTKIFLRLNPFMLTREATNPRENEIGWDVTEADPQNNHIVCMCINNGLK